jgi:hypothetical protein
MLAEAVFEAPEIRTRPLLAGGQVADSRKIRVLLTCLLGVDASRRKKRQRESSSGEKAAPVHSIT